LVDNSESAHTSHQRIADLARELYGQPMDHGADPILQRIVGYAVSAIPAADYAGVTLIVSGTDTETPAASHPYPALLDTVQHNHGEGPCFEAARSDSAIRLHDLVNDRRWPRFRRDALRVAPVRSIVSFGLFTSDSTMAALNVYADRPNVFSDDDVDLGYAVATHAALAWDAQRRETQFRSGLASRDLIGQAKGILMNHFDIDAVAAFDLLRRLSQQTNTRLVDVADQVVTVRSLQDFDLPGNA
jgi:GAF domain-containing protein